MSLEEKVDYLTKMVTELQIMLAEALNDHEKLQQISDRAYARWEQDMGEDL